MPIAFDPPLPLPHTALLGLAACVVAVWMARRSGRGMEPRRRLLLSAIRVGIAICLTLILLNPVAVSSGAPRSSKPPLVVLVDTSGSMAATDGRSGRSRLADGVASTLADSSWLAAARKHADVKLYGFSDTPQKLDRAPALSDIRSGRRTSIGAALAGVASVAEGGRIVLVSDGRDTADSFPLDAARMLKSRSIAVDTLCVGRRTEMPDVEVDARRAQVYAAPGQFAKVGVEVRANGPARKSTAVHLRLLEAGKLAAARSVELRSGRAEADFPVRKPTRGAYRYVVQAEPVPGERNTLNNRAGVVVNVMDSQARVLLLEGRPSWDSRFLAQTLRADSGIRVDVLYKLTDSRYFAVLSAGRKETGIELPRTLDQLSRYDVIMVGKGFEEFYDESNARTLKEWVSERGGNLLFLRGRADERTAGLRDIEPLTWTGQDLDRVQMELTDDGRSHPGFSFDGRTDARTVVKSMPPLITASRVQGEKALSVILARSAGDGGGSAKHMATIAYMRFGRGKSMALVGQGMWQWAFLPPDMQPYGRVYEEFWSHMIRWMVSDSDFLPGQSASLRVERTLYSPGDTVNLFGYLRSRGGAAPPSLEVTDPDGRKQAIAAVKADGKLADFTATLRPDKQGDYLVSMAGATGSPTCGFTVSGTNEEDANTAADPELMRRIAAETGGTALSLRDARSLPGRIVPSSARETMDAPRTAWDRAWILASLLLAVAAEWWLRRRSALV